MENINLTPKTIFVGIAGRPNVGKSTLLNRLLGEKIAAVSKKPQTTRTRITGVITRAQTQYVFLDTPGIHRPKTKLGESMIKAVRESISDIDCLLFMTEVCESVGSVERELLEKMKRAKVPVVMLINKTDAVKKTEILKTIDIYTREFEFASVIPISALDGDNVDIIFEEIAPFIRESDWFFPSDMLTDQPERVIAAEMIREKLLRLLDDEVPHGIAVVIEDFYEKKGVLFVRAEIFCEKEGHKRIIIGKGGSMLKKVGTYARGDMEDFFRIKVNLDLWVKVKENWRDSVASINNFGLSNKD